MLIERLLKVALLGSEWVLYLLALLSVISVTLVAERWFYFRRRSGDIDDFRQRLTLLLDKGDALAASKLCASSRMVEAKVTQEALRWAHAGPPAIGDAVDSELGRLKKDLEAGTTFLGTVGNNAPFVGLFGTVLGVIIAFEALGKTGENSGAMGSVMAGIAEALVATGVGLFVALPAVVSYNTIQKRIGEIEVNTASLAKLLMAYAHSDPKLFADPRLRARTSQVPALIPGRSKADDNPDPPAA
jgi:biopolymer transport protein ExbB/TolQ